MSKSPAEQTANVVFRFPKKKLAQARQLAAKEGVTLSKVLQGKLDEWLADCFGRITHTAKR